MLEAPLNPALEKQPRVIQAREIARKAVSVEDLVAGARQIDMSDHSASPVLVPGRYGDQCPDKHPIMLLNKAPAATEVERGRPFQGPAGQFLAKTIEHSDQHIESFYQAHASYWRPRKENTPTETQMAISRPLIHREIEIVQPRRIIVLGAKAADSLYGCHSQMTEDEETVCEWRGIEVVVIRNHGYLMRNPRLLESYAEQIKRWGY